MNAIYNALYAMWFKGRWYGVMSRLDTRWVAFGRSLSCNGIPVTSRYAAEWTPTGIPLQENSARQPMPGVQV
ncbi:hypothetical protein [Prevotella sp. MGM1]|uniref:hypothetical protein n=1 Tax=Prevotella sp. MGM1 TaxID=2033405 RepID=UPI0011B02EEC|nr:hypothetical protein [Prevotella sp. MGM1]